MSESASGFRPIIYTAIVPVSVGCFFLTRVVHVASGVWTAMLRDLEASPSAFTSAVLVIGVSPFVFLLPVALTIAMVVFAHRRPLNDAVVIVLASLACELVFVLGLYGWVYGDIITIIQKL
ncbi:MAG: hypothetical protein AB7O52_17680 [Planctomycetota bacterium]